MSTTTPNVLLIHCHDLGRHLSCYGRDIETPSIAALAEEGVRFDEYYCTAPQCGPSRSSINTGRHPHENGLMGHYWLGWEIHDDVPTLPQLLGDAGYDTTTFGIQHLGDDAETVGYDAVGCESSRAADVAPAIETFLDQRTAESRPFYASVGIGEPHRQGRRFDVPGYDSPSPNQVETPPYLPDVPVVREQIAGIYGMIRAVDDAVDRIMTTLDETGLAEETIVIFTTDHGLAMPRAKGMCYDPGVETALLMRYPGVFPEGAVRDELLSNVDLLPTLLSFLDIDVPPGVTGRSFLPLLTGGSYDERDHVFLEITYHDKYNPIRGIRTSEHKYLRTFDDQPLVYLPLDILMGPDGRALYENYYGEARPKEELYDLSTDPYEQENRIDDPAYEEIAADLRGRVDAWMESTDDPLLSGDVPVPPEHCEVLRTYPW